MTTLNSEFLLRRISAVLGLALTVFLVGSPNTVSAGSPPIGVIDYTSSFSDVNGAAPGLADFDGTSFATLGSGDPIDTLETTLFGGIEQDFADTVFSIDSGFVVGTTIVISSDATIGPGDSVLATIGSGAFSFSNGSGDIITGSFDSAEFQGIIGGAAGASISSDPNGLDLSAGSEFKFDNGNSVDDILDPEGFVLNFVSIPGGIGATATGETPVTVAGLFIIPATLDSFGVSNGSVSTSGTLSIVPEPSTLLLAALGLLSLLGFHRRRPRAA